MPLCVIDVFGDDPGAVSVEGAICGHLSVQRCCWSCRDGQLDYAVLSLNAVALPAAEPSEPIAAALARLSQQLRGSGAYLIIESLSRLDPAVHQHCGGCRFLRLETQADRDIWDKLLSLGLPVYGLSERVYCSMSKPQLPELLQNLVFGACYCSNGLELKLEESPRGCSITAAQELRARVIVRGGLEVVTLSGQTVNWTDQGNEGYVRLEVEAAAGQWAWTQPRFVAGPEQTV
jgi:hypothetical protein